MRSVRPWWQQATALVTVSTGGVITGLNFVPGAAATMTSPTSVPVHLLALEQGADPGTLGHLAAGGGSAGAVSSDAQLRSAIVNVAGYYLRLAKTRTPAQMEALIWDNTSTNGTDHGPSCAAFASLTLELAAQAVGQQSWVTGGSSYPWPLPEWADVRVETNPASPDVTSLVADAQQHGRWHPLGDGYAPQPGDWVVFDGHVEVVTSDSGGVLGTIGADSLPGLTVNAHSFRAPLAGQGVAGFVDNGELKSAPATLTASAAATGQASASTTTTAAPGRAQSAAAGSAGTGSAKAALVPGVLATGDLLGRAAGGTGAAAGAGRADAESVATIPGLPSGTPITKPMAAAAPASAAKAPAASPTTASASSAAGSSESSSASSLGRQYATPGTRSQQTFINLVAPGAIAAQQRYGVPASVTIAQAIEESAWGTSGLAAQYHNLFGIKGTGPAGSVTMPTSEYLNGQWVSIDAQFRAYTNDAQSIADHAELLATSGYYTRAMADRAVPDAFANDLTGVYATDPHYGANLIALMQLYNLYRFDSAGMSPAATPATHTASPAATPKGGRAPAPAAPAAGGTGGRTASGTASGRARVPGVATPTLVPAAPKAGIAGQRAGTGMRIPGLVSPGTQSTAATPARGTSAGTARGAARIPGTGAAGIVTTSVVRYEAQLPPAVTTAFFASAKTPLARGEHLYRDVAAGAGIGWELLAAVDWMQCKADPRRSPVHGEKLGSPNADGTSYSTKSGALAQCARDLIELAAAVYGIDLTARRRLSVRALAAAFASFRWGAILQRHGVSAMEFPYSVAGLTAQHQKMHWPPVDAPDAPDRPGGRFREPFGAVPVVLSLGYPATV